MSDLMLKIERELYGMVCIEMSEETWVTDEEQVDARYEEYKTAFAKWIVGKFMTEEK